MTRRLTRTAAERQLMNGADHELHDALCILVLLQEAEEGCQETDQDSDNLSSPQSRRQRLLGLVEQKLRRAMLAIEKAL